MPAFPVPCNIRRIKISTAIQVYKFASAQIYLSVIIYNGVVAIDLHDIFYGLTPFASSQFRTLRAAPLSVSGTECD